MLSLQWRINQQPGRESSSSGAASPVPGRSGRWAKMSRSKVCSNPTDRLRTLAVYTRRSHVARCYVTSLHRGTGTGIADNFVIGLPRLYAGRLKCRDWRFAAASTPPRDRRHRFSGSARLPYIIAIIQSAADKNWAGSAKAAAAAAAAANLYHGSSTDARRLTLRLPRAALSAKC